MKRTIIAGNFFLSGTIVCALFIITTFTFVPPSEARPPHHEDRIVENGGYTGPGPAVITVKEASQREDGEWIVLRGRIIQSLTDKEYLFEDSTGKINIHIGPREWQGQSIGAEDTIEIQGKMHREWMQSHIHVKKITKQ